MRERYLILCTLSVHHSEPVMQLIQLQLQFRKLLLGAVECNTNGFAVLDNFFDLFFLVAQLCCNCIVPALELPLDCGLIPRVQGMVTFHEWKFIVKV